jgi:aspartyl-tRNA(Asn)/glutamyl-tRNA(Gln) amidotransferase subunit B
MKEYLTTIGLEIHLQLSTKTKAFCGCLNEFGREPNTLVCPVCLGMPGSLPVLNQEYFFRAIKVALALNSKVADRMKFDRKNYFYPDLPKNYQISQYDMPLSKGGFVEIIANNEVKKIGITRVHMEEDAGKLMHDEREPYSYVDYNRTGTPLLEIVSEPDITSPDEAYSYLVSLKSILSYLDVSDCSMEKGSLRCDANISIRPKHQTELGVKVELKNMNSFKAIKQALEYEEKRQSKSLSQAERIIQQTRLWNEDKKRTEPMRTKEEAHDYRYFPDPDLSVFTIDSDLINRIRESLPEMPQVKCKRFQQAYGISGYDASILISDKAMSDFFESCIRLYPQPKLIANWLIGQLQAYINENNIEFKLLKITPEHLSGMIELIDKGIINNNTAKDVLIEMLISGKTPNDIVKEKDLSLISDKSVIESLAYEVLKENLKVKEDYISGKKNALSFLVGQLMKKCRGKADPAIANQAFITIIEKEKA